VKALIYIAPLKAGIVSACLYSTAALLFLPFVLIMSMVGAMAPNGNGGSGAAMGLGLGLLIAVAALVFYAIMGFVAGILVAAIYNVIAKFTGGLEFKTQEVKD
jgi:hypothetical protein